MRLVSTSLRYWHLLSLDAPTVAGLWCWAFGRAVRLHLSPRLPVALALGTWLFYVADRLLDAGCRVLMPWGAPIGSGRGLNNLFGLKALRSHFPDVPLVIDAGIGVPSHAAMAMELGFDAVLINTAVAHAADPVRMAAAFAQAIEAGTAARLAGPMEPRDLAEPSTPVIGTAFLK